MNQEFIESAGQTACILTLSPAIDPLVSERRTARYVYLGAHGVGYVSLGAMTLWTLHENLALLYAVFMEVVVAQAHLLTINCVLSSGSLVKRVVGTALGMACLAVFPLFAFNYTDNSWDDFGTSLIVGILGLAGMVSSVALLLTLIFLRIFGHAPRIVDFESPLPAARNRWQFSILHLLWLTSLTGISVWILKWMLANPNAQFTATVLPGLILAFDVLLILGIATYVQSPLRRGLLTLLITPLSWLPFMPGMEVLLMAPYAHSFVVLISLTTLPRRGFRLTRPNRRESTASSDAGLATSTAGRSD